MTSTWLIVLLVVVWLLVLVPMIVNTREPIRRTSKAFSDTRVLHRGDEKKLSPRRIISPRPVQQDISDESDPIIEDTADSQERNITVAAKAQHDFIQATLPFDEESIPDMDTVTEEIPLTAELISESLDIYEDVSTEDVDKVVEETVSDTVKVDTAEDTTVDESTEDAAEEMSQDVANAADEGILDGDRDEEISEEVTEDEVAEDTVEDSDDDAAELGVDAAEAVAYAETTEHADTPQTSLTGKLADIISGFTKSDRNIPNPAPQMTLDAEDIAYAERRRGRGGFDPVADQKAATKRYRRRGIIFLFMLVLFIPAIVTAAVYSGFVWIAPVLWLGVIAFYLTALRSQVRLEKQLRAKRIARLRRARYEQAEYEQDRNAGRSTSFRGQYLLVDTDDGDPVFEHLDTKNFMTRYIAEHASDFTYDESGYLRDQFGKVHLNPEHYPDGLFGEDPRRARTAAASAATPEHTAQDNNYPGYYDPYSPAQYVGGTSVDYWTDEEEARTAPRFDMPTNGDYLNVS